MKTFEFNTTLRGVGNTPEEAWANAVECFAMDPGDGDDNVAVFDPEDVSGEVYRDESEQIAYEEYCETKSEIDEDSMTLSQWRQAAINLAKYDTPI